MDDEQPSKEVAALGFPIEHKHKLCCLRQELLDSFVESRYMMFIKYAAFHLQQLSHKNKTENNADKKTDNTENKEQTDNESTNQTKDNSQESQLEADEAKKLVESITASSEGGVSEKKELEESTKEIVKTAALAVGSLKDTEFDIRFNPDVYSPGIRHCEQGSPPLNKQRQLVRDAAEFLVTVQIPSFVSIFFFLLSQYTVLHWFNWFK